MRAISNGHLGVVRLLVERGACIHGVCRSDWTPIYFAVHDTNEDMVRLLLAAGADKWLRACDRLQQVDL